MAHEKLAEKLGDYFARLGAGKAHKIKPHDVERVITKLRTRREDLREELARKPEKAERLQHKIKAADELIARAEWLRAELAGEHPD